MGAASGGVVAPISAIPVYAVLVALVLAIMLFTYKKCLGLVYNMKAMHDKDPEDVKAHVRKAIDVDPFNSHYLVVGARTHFDKDPMYSLDCTLTSLYNYDGGITLWGAWSDVGHMVMRVMAENNFGIPKWATENALRLYPGYPPAMDVDRFLREVSEQAARPLKIA
jgi:hypothetical protein